MHLQINHRRKLEKLLQTKLRVHYNAKLARRWSTFVLCEIQPIKSQMARCVAGLQPKYNGVVINICKDNGITNRYIVTLNLVITMTNKPKPFISIICYVKTHKFSDLIHNENASCWEKLQDLFFHWLRKQAS